MQELSTLQAKFEENLLDATNAWSRRVLNRAELAGLPKGVMDLAREAAREKKQEGWLFKLDFPDLSRGADPCRQPGTAPGILRGMGDEGIRAGTRWRSLG